MSQRYVRFDINELARLATEAVGAKSCVSVEKYPDGMYNKAMLLTMDDVLHDGSRVYISSAILDRTYKYDGREGATSSLLSQVIIKCFAPH